MKIRKVAVGNAAEAFIEGNFTNGVNIISSDDNNKGKTIVIQSMMYALGNEPTFPTSFEFQKYYYYIEFEEAGIIFKLCRSGDGFVLKRESTVLIDKQVILTTTLKHEEIGKYDDLPDVNHINYQSHTPSKILDGAFVESFVALLNDLSIEI